MILKRAIDVLGAAFGLLLLAPVLLGIGVLVKIDSPGPVFFRQMRVGRFGKTFYMHKFRTMIRDAPSRGAAITATGDPRITQSGRWLRKYKLDELPQLFDVLSGEMSLVGPRPELPQFVAAYPQDIRALILSVRPGMTDNASLEFIDENELLVGIEDPELEYRERILPIKIRYYLDYVEHPSVMRDVSIMLRTAARLLFR